MGNGWARLALAQDRFIIDLDWNRRSAGILAALQRLAGSGHAGAGDGKQVGALAQADLRGFHLDEFFAFQSFQDLVNQSGEWQGHFFGHLEAAQVALEVEYFQSQVL